MQQDWQPSPEKFEISDGELHIWKSRLPAEDNGWQDWLSPDELARGDRFQFAPDRRMFHYSRSLLRRILGNYLKVFPARVAFLYTEFGKPYLPDAAEGRQLEFNLSHSGETVCIAVTRAVPVGIDVEKVKPSPDLDQVAERFFSAGERQDLASLTGQTKVAAFYRCWTRKEALIKASGEGLSMPLDQFRVSLLPGEPAQLLQSADGRTWHIIDLKPYPGYIGAAAVPVKQLRISRYSGEDLLMKEDLC